MGYHKILDGLNNVQRFKKNHPEQYEAGRWKGVCKSKGITPEEYNVLFNQQLGCCKICGKHQTELKKKLFIDHCHITKKVRGLLCQKCNTAIAFLNDNIQSLKNAIEYLS